MGQTKKSADLAGQQTQHRADEEGAVRQHLTLARLFNNQLARWPRSTNIPYPHSSPQPLTFSTKLREKRSLIVCSPEISLT